MVDWRQLVKVGAASGAIVILGTLGYYLLGITLRLPASLLDCLYMTVITLTTVGYEEVIPVARTEVGKLFSIMLILGGVGVFLYILTNLAILLLEGVIQGAWERWRVEKEIAKMSDHYLVCGVGRVGEVIVRELVLIQRPVVIIDKDAEKVTSIGRELNVPFIVGDATDEAVLKASRIESARGLLAALGNDHDNLFLVLTARSLNPNLKIVARSNHPSVVDKMLKAGADEVVLPETSGGLRMVSLMVRPTAVSFLDQMLRLREVTVRVEEITIEPSSPLVGKRLGELKLPQNWNTLVLAYQQESGNWVYNPPGDLELKQGMSLIVMGDVQKLEELRRLARGT
ncbi:MAG: potassium channel family protein [Candidatus Fervidibacter sp.]|uniref:potassium channel family protein n=1 Tax=Candidatus Fervidibacter sp. TaxID=3100871 RepID=UPI00404B6534